MRTLNGVRGGEPVDLSFTLQFDKQNGVIGFTFTAPRSDSN